MSKEKTTPTTASATLSAESLLLGLLTLQIEEREAKGFDLNRTKTEILLASAGLTYQQIAAMMNKNPDAVRMMLVRNTKPVKKAEKDGKTSK